MRTGSQRFAGTLVALGFVAGWFSASWVSPPTATTQVAPPRPAAAAPEVPLPRIALDEVTAPETRPATVRNPFVFAARHDVPPVMRLREADLAPLSDLTAPTAASPQAEPPAWRVVGMASDGDGRYTAVVSGGGDVFLVVLGDMLPDGLTVAEVDAGGAVLTRVTGERLVLRLP